MSRILGASAIALMLAACGSSSDDGATGGGNTGGGGAGGSESDGGNAGTGGAGGSGGDAGSAGMGGTGGMGGMGGSGGSGGGMPTPACPTATYKTLVVIGDSISDVGGSGGPDDQQPFYRTLLVQNDDTLYPDWKGIDMKTCWGLDPNTGVVKVSKGGAIATEKSGPASVLVDQVKSLPATLEGPVLVVGTIGGNDVLAGFTDYLIGTPQQQQADRDGFYKGWDDAMAELTKADRFGAGVKVDVLITNIYDPTGGTGDFTYAPEGKGCGGAFALWPKNQSTDPALTPWNDGLITEAGKYPGVHLLDLHKLYLGHQVDTAAADNWYHDDCIHPNAAGHNAIRGLFWAGLQALP